MRNRYSNTQASENNEYKVLYFGENDYNILCTTKSIVTYDESNNVPFTAVEINIDHKFVTEKQLYEV